MISSHYRRLPLMNTSDFGKEVIAMKAKKMIALAVVLVLILTMSGVALAIPSPTGSTVTGTSANVSKVEVRAITVAKQEALT